MKTVGYQQLYNTHDKCNRPSLIVASGEPFRVSTQLQGGDWLGSLDDHWVPQKSQGPNLTVCIGVENAHPGDTLAVEILDLAVDKVGYTGFAGWRLDFSRALWPNDWDIVERTVAIENGFVRWNDRLSLPVAPMIGTLGTAPAGEGISNRLAARHGGNMDVQEVCKGTTVYLPVEVEGALLHVGDVHAIMGDGEINNGGGIECRGEVTLRATVLSGSRGLGWLRMENADYLMTVACESEARASFQSAARELISWMCEDYEFDPKEAYLLLGQVLEARATVLVSPMISYICKIPKRYLLPASK